MKRVIVIASHHRMADGLKETLNFITGGLTEVVSLSAYVDNRPVEEEIDELMNGFADEDEVVVLTDLTSGSVNQKFFKYRNRPHTHIVSGINLPLCSYGCYGASGRIISVPSVWHRLWKRQEWKLNM